MTRLIIEYETTKYWNVSLLDIFKLVQQFMLDVGFAGNIERFVITNTNSSPFEQTIM